MNEITTGELFSIREALTLAQEEVASVIDHCDLVLTSGVFEAIEESLEIVDGILSAALRQQLQKVEEELNEETSDNP